jgi:hypothetical protein
LFCNYESPLTIFLGLISFFWFAGANEDLVSPSLSSLSDSVCLSLSQFSPHGFLFTLEVLHNTTWPQRERGKERGERERKREEEGERKVKT